MDDRDARPPLYAQIGPFTRVAAFVSLIAAVALLLAANPSRLARADAPAALWFADHKTVKQLDPATDTVTRHIALDHAPQALAVDPADGALWVLVEKTLYKFGAGGDALLAIDLKRASDKLDHPKHLALDPYDRSLWVAGERRLLHLSAQGDKLLEWSSPGRIEAVAVDLDQSLWLLTDRKILQLFPDGYASRQSRSCDRVGTFPGARAGRAGRVPVGGGRAGAAEIQPQRLGSRTEDRRAPRPGRGWRRGRRRR